ncbi:MAG: hypothetical protein KKD18_03030 [Nanoarchaeota archaeon]|nr:hypothetical protein [Nanoarchaeota archaeon]MBU0977364.1 hypothetical protein [Nanoarchaeota archaeon]
MDVKKFFSAFLEGLNTLVKMPLFMLLSLVLWGLLLGVSKIGGRIVVNFQSTTSNVLWIIVAGLVSFSLISYFSSGLIGLTQKKELKNFFVQGNKNWFRNLLVLLVILVSTAAVWAIAHYGTLYFGRTLNLDAAVAKWIFIWVYVTGLVGFLIFFSFASFFLVLHNRPVVGALSESFRFVKRNYFTTLFLMIVFFALYFLVNFVEGAVGDLLLFGLLFPYLIIVFTRILNTADLKK